MKEVVLEGPTDDASFFEYLGQVGQPIRSQTTGSYEGIQETIQAIVPLVSILIPVIVAWISGSRNRSFTIDGEKMIFKGQSLKEIHDFLSKHQNEASPNDEKGGTDGGPKGT